MVRNRILYFSELVFRSIQISNTKAFTACSSLSAACLKLDVRLHLRVLFFDAFRIFYLNKGCSRKIFQSLLKFGLLPKIFSYAMSNFGNRTQLLGPEFFRNTTHVNDSIFLILNFIISTCPIGSASPKYFLAVSAERMIPILCQSKRLSFSGF